MGLYKVSFRGPVGRGQADILVLFNYRYNPCHWKVEEVISSGKIGNVKSVHFEWLLVSFEGQEDYQKLIVRIQSMERTTSDDGTGTRTDLAV
jgi:predicted dehydrogenase